MWEEEKGLLKKWLQWEVKDEDLSKGLEEFEVWDSFNIVHFMTVIEENYNTSVTVQDMVSIQDVGDLLKYIKKCNDMKESEKCAN